MKNILMATDLSARSDRALERALRLATDHAGNLTIVHIVDEALPSALADAQRQAAEQTIRQQLDALDHRKGPRVSIEVAVGRAYADIIELSAKTAAEVIVLGLHRKDPIKDMFRGTTAERVIRAGSVPVLLVKESATDAYRRVMVGVDFSVCSRRALEFAIRFVPSGEFHLVHAYDVPFRGFLYGESTQQEVGKQQQAKFARMIEDEMATFLANVQTNAPAFERVMKRGTVRDVIQRQVDELKPDLLVVGTHGRTGVAHAFLGSVAEDLLRDPPLDILAVNAW